jgi:hypothetical protein
MKREPASACLALPERSLGSELDILKAAVAALVLRGHRYLAVHGRGPGSEDLGQADRRTCAISYRRAGQVLRQAASDLPESDPRHRARLLAGIGLQPDNTGRTHNAAGAFHKLALTFVSPYGPVVKFDIDECRAACELERLTPSDRSMIEAVAAALDPIGFS